ncbi:hypothetical protein AAIB41_07590 [Brucella sp. BE17]|uniref:hypothetical protein n=1 Tax=Brucella sp. BE17 TaxID=3142977 RepID=UPI0031BB5D9C
MTLKEIQALEHAARTAMAGNDDPLPSAPSSFRVTYLGLAFLAICVLIYLVFA